MGASSAYRSSPVLRLALGAFLLWALPMAALGQSSASDFNNRGVDKQARGDLDGAIADFTRAIDLDPNSAAAYINRGSVRLAKGDFDGAIADYSRGIKIDPANATAYYNRGVARAAKRDLDQALADYNHTLELDATNAMAYYNRGTIRGAKGDLAGAIADYSHTLEIEPNFALAYINRSIAKRAKGDFDGAVADCTRALEINPKDPDAYINRGHAKRAKGDLDGAVADYNRGRELDPQRAALYYCGVGYARQARGDLDGAIAEFTHALKIDPTFAPAYNSRGNVYFTQRDWTNAMADFRRGCEADSKDQDYARLAIWLIRTRTDDKEAASKELAAYMEQRTSATDDDWLSKIAGFLLDKIDQTHLLAAAESKDPRIDSTQHCQAWFYCGMKHLLAGDQTTAAECFKKCLATQRTTYTEYQFAEAELKALAHSP